MKNILFIFLLIFLINSSFSQNKTCDTPKEETYIDLSSITKCTVKDSKKSKNKRSRQISVKVSAPKRRYLKKRAVAKKSEASSIGSIGASGVTNTAKTNQLSKTLALKTNIANIKDKLSAEQVRKADKFSTVDDLPTFKDCKSATKGEKMDCFNTEMIKHIQKHFSYPHEAVMNKVQGDVWVRFIIDENGDISNIKALGPKGAKILNDEAIRVVSLLPKFAPATKKGEKVPVKYGFPISFSLDEN